MFLERIIPRLVAGLEGTALTIGERRILSETPPAGVILFERNVADLDQLRRLTTEIRQAVEARAGVAPLIMADHEGGRISVLHRAIGIPPSQMAIARTGSGRLCAETYRETACRLRGCGVNLLLGPVADINSEYLNPVIGTRSFGEEESVVTAFVREAVKALGSVGMLSCLKHFPGHGATSRDSHLTLPVLGLTTEQLVRKDLLPFNAGVEAGADTVMTGHIVPHDRQLPASLDGELVDRFLRSGAGFDGVVVTDALEMKGIWVRADGAGGSAERTFAEIFDSALGAGNDLLLFSGPVEEVYGELERLAGEAGTEGILDAGEHGKSLERIGRLRAKAAGTGVDDSSAPGREAVNVSTPHGGNGAVVGGESTRAIGAEGVTDPYRAVANGSVRVLGGQEPLPLAASRPKRIVFVGEREDFASAVIGRFMERLLGSMQAPRSPQDGGAPLGSDGLKFALRCHVPGREGMIELFELAVGEKEDGGAAVLVLLNRKPLWHGAVRHLSERADAVLIAGWPYAAGFMLGDRTAVVTYGIYDAAADTAGEILFGARNR
jgi:beta-N-acetylhexosaminidase